MRGAHDVFSLEVCRARKGDCLILHYGTRAEPGLVVINGGPAWVYKLHLKPRLDAIKRARSLDPQEALPINLLMVSHVDDDHIHGILDLTRELSEAKDERRPASFRVRRLWHNSFDDIIGNHPEELRAAITAQFGAAAYGGRLVESNDIEPDAAMVLAGVAQGHRLRDDARRLHIPINPEFDGRLVWATVDDRVAIPLDLDLNLTVIGPAKPELIALQEKHDKWLRDRQLKRNSPEVALAAFSDKSVANLSSIVVLAEIGGKRILLTGDARGDKILEGLEATGLLDRDGTLHVDVLKVPHHGSGRNVEPIFFKRLTADHYVFSGNGEHGNPERKTLEMLFGARRDAEFVLHFTYPIDEIDQGRKEEWMRRWQDGVEWSDKRQSLVALLNEKHGADMRAQIEITSDRAPHLIDLLDPAPR